MVSGNRGGEKQRRSCAEDWRLCRFPSRRGKITQKTFLLDGKMGGGGGTRASQKIDETGETCESCDGGWRLAVDGGGSFEKCIRLMKKT